MTSKTTTTKTASTTNTTTYMIQMDSCRRSFTSGEDYANIPAVCECGRTLTAGWQCNYCRKNCPYCHRALTTHPEDFCDRCFRLCKFHGLYHCYDVKTGYRRDHCPSCQIH
ncbi:hypothetical protein BDC45DRAFT_521911 [Circinella umbellata]|nr:hypothetical protein BDC45DRAFT_521911 [Circinella umbellata]